MKGYSISIAILFSFLFATGQKPDYAVKDSVRATNNTVFTFVEQMPEFPGGDAALMKFLQTNIQYPKKEVDNNIQGKVLVRFIVMEDGRVDSVRVIRNISPGLDQEAVRVMKMLPNFKPGKQQGKAVRVYYNMPIVFKLQDDKDKEDALIKEKINKDANFRDAMMNIKGGSIKDAIKSLKKSIKKFPNDYMSYELKAECELKLGNTKDCCADYKLAQQKGSPSAADALKKNCNKNVRRIPSRQ